MPGAEASTDDTPMANIRGVITAVARVRATTRTNSGSKSGISFSARLSPTAS